MRRAVLFLAALGLTLSTTVAADAIPVLPPLRTSPNVQLLANIPGSYAGLVFQGDYAYATGWPTGLTVFDISEPELPVPVGALPLPHFENEDVDLCGDTLLITHDQAEGVGAALPGTCPSRWTLLEFASGGSAGSAPLAVEATFRTVTTAASPASAVSVFICTPSKS